MTASVTPGREEMDRIELALTQAQSCIKGETPEDVTFGEAEDDTFSKIRTALDDVAELRRLAAKPADEGVRDAISKAYFIQRTYDKNSGAHIISFGFNLKEDALVLENLSTTGEPKR